MLANQANRLLDNALALTQHNHGEPPRAREQIEIVLATLDDWCIQCEHDLERIFGVLGAPPRTREGG